MLYSILAAAGDAGVADPTQLPFDPWVLGPLAGLVLVLFLFELIVPGKTHKRLLEDYQKSRELNEKVIPLADKMVDSQSELAEAIERVTRVMEDILRIQSEQQYEDAPPRRRGVR